MAKQGLLTFKECAALLDADLWKVRRIYQDGLLPLPEKVGTVFLVDAQTLPELRAALQRRGYLNQPGKAIA